MSVLTAYYNTDESFLETARSILNQSLQTWEWVIVDDGSTDPDAVTRLAATAAAEPRMRIFRQDNTGPAAARNRAFRESMGQYVCLLDSDDLLEPTYLEKCVWFLESHPNFGFCNSWTANFGEEEFFWRIGFERGKAHIESNSGPIFSVIRREAYAACGGFDASIRLGHEDWDFWLAMANAGYWGHTLPEYLQWYRKRKTGRYFRVMASAGLHREFESMVARKYASLETRFPAPRRCPPAAFEAVSSELPFPNLLAKDPNTRRILFLIPWMVTGGADRVNLDWIGLLRQRGYQVTVCATLESDHNWLHEFTKLTPDVFVLPNFLRLVDFPRFVLYLIRSRQIDTLLVSGSTLGYQILPYLRAFAPEVAFLDLCHAEEPHWLNGGHPRFGVGYQEMLDLNLVTTGHLRAWMRGRGADGERIAVCHSGIDLRDRQSDALTPDDRRTPFGRAESLPVIIFAGRICDQKRPLFFADILGELSRRGVEFEALVVGDGELRGALEQRVETLGLKGPVRFLGTLDHANWLATLAQADIFLLPSQYEGISVALLEAMALGVVPVASAVGGQAEAMTPDVGFLIPQRDGELDAYATALVQLLGDSKQRLSMGQAAREWIERNFSREATAARLLSLLDLAHDLAVSDPRQRPSPGFARELATLAVEYARLSRVADQLWTQRVQAASGIGAADTPIPLNGIALLLTRLGNTRIGSAVLRSKKLRKLGQWMLNRFPVNQSQSP